MCKPKNKCTACDDLWDYLHFVNSPEPPCENCPYDDIEEDIIKEDVEKEEEMYAQ
jgi:hypothetical protein